MTCLKCLNPTASTVGFRQPEADVLCIDHLLWLLRERRRYRCANDSCGRKLLAGPDRVCEWCRLGRPVTQAVTTEMMPVKILRGAEYLAARDAALKDVSGAESENMVDDSEEDDDE